MTRSALEVKNLNKSFGGVHAIRDLSFTVEPGEILGLIGPNGSGKSTTVNCLAGLLPVTSGEITLGGAAVQDRPEYERVSLGLTRTFQTASVFPEFTVREQVRLGGHSTGKQGLLSRMFSRSKSGRRSDEDSSRVEEVLELTGLQRIADQKVGTISSADQRFLMIATALAADPKVILLDEPAAGLILQERQTLSALIRAIRDQGTSVLVIEHHMALIMEVCDRIVVLNFGSKIAEGNPAEIRTNKAVIEAYLGEAA